MFGGGLSLRRNRGFGVPNSMALCSRTGPSLSTTSEDEFMGDNFHKKFMAVLATQDSSAPSTRHYSVRTRAWLPWNPSVRYRLPHPDGVTQCPGCQDDLWYDNSALADCCMTRVCLKCTLKKAMQIACEGGHSTCWHCKETFTTKTDVVSYP